MKNSRTIMGKTVWVVIVLTFVLFAGCKKREFNLDMEVIGQWYPLGWYNYGSPDYRAYADSLYVYSGKYSGAIECIGENWGYRNQVFCFPDRYKGKEITLSGYIRTENITEGFAGLWMEVGNEIAWEEILRQKITGTKDWERYEITMKMGLNQPSKIIVGGLMAGKGKMWLDNLQVCIDGKDITMLEPFELGKIGDGGNSLAGSDREFDKGSKVLFPELGESLIDNLDLLGKIWGFLKYHHPAVARGDYNWDYELFRILPDYLKADKVADRDRLLLQWIKKLGRVSASNVESKVPANAVLIPDFSWVEDSDMGEDLIEEIRTIYINRYQGEQYYVKEGQSSIPEFWHESSYSSMTYPDAGFRLLALYRYWNVMRYFFPYRNLCDKDWNQIQRAYIPRFLAASTELEYEQTVLALVCEIKDSHGFLAGGFDQLEAWKGWKFAPFRAQYIEKKWVVTDFDPNFQAETGLKIGDVITHIDGKAVEEIADSLMLYSPMSNEAAGRRDIAFDLLRSNQSAITVGYISSGRAKEARISLYAMEKLDIDWKKRKWEKQPTYRFIRDDIGYVTLATIQQEDITRIKKMFKQTKGLIIDIRNYPSTWVVNDLGAYFVSDFDPFVCFSSPDFNHPGVFTRAQPVRIFKSGDTYRGKVVVLVNEETQSQAELTAMAFRAGKNTCIVGSTTAGADGNLVSIDLPGGLTTTFSSLGVYYPDGTGTQRTGIIPDIWVEPTIDGIKSGRDEVLEKAIEQIF